MKNRHARSSLSVLISVLALAIVAPVSSSWAMTKNKDCYRASDDHDGDGYAAADSTAVSVTMDKWDIVCPSGYLNYAGDCDDDNSTIHPYNTEATGSVFKDDNCNGQVDEPEFIYALRNPFQTMIRVEFTINDIDAAALSSQDRLYYEADYSRLSHQSEITTISKRKLAKGTINASGIVVSHFYVTGLEATTVYRIRFRLYARRSNGTYRKANGDSSWYYATTTDLYNEVSQARTKILTKGFRQYGDSQAGLVGYRGSDDSDGTRYGASSNQMWCTEFYSWVTEDYIKYAANETYVGGMLYIFKLFGNDYGANRIGDLGKRGDYMPFGPVGEDADHSTMFLAIDRTGDTPVVRTLEGNVGDKVVISSHDLNGGEFKGLGHITSGMLKD